MLRAALQPCTRPLLVLIPAASTLFQCVASCLGAWCGLVFWLRSLFLPPRCKLWLYSLSVLLCCGLLLPLPFQRGRSSRCNLDHPGDAQASHPLFLVVIVVVYISRLSSAAYSGNRPRERPGTSLEACLDTHPYFQFPLKVGRS